MEKEPIIVAGYVYQNETLEGDFDKKLLELSFYHICQGDLIFPFTKNNKLKKGDNIKLITPIGDLWNFEVLKVTDYEILVLG